MAKTSNNKAIFFYSILSIYNSGIHNNLHTGKLTCFVSCCCLTVFNTVYVCMRIHVWCCVCVCVCVCVCKCVMDHMSEHEVCGDLADKQWCFTLKRQNCDTPKTPEARFWIQLSILSPSFHRPSSWSVPLFSLPSLALSCIFFFIFY